MKSGIATLMVVGVAASVALFALSSIDSAKPTFLHKLTSEEELFNDFVAKYGKSYQTTEEYDVRFEQFKMSMAAITDENNVNDNTFTCGLN